MAGFEYRAPETLEEVCAALDEQGDDARLIAGGTALILLIKQRLVQPAVLVSLKRLRELSSIERVDGSIRIGATTTHRRIETEPLIREHLPTLAETLRCVATPRVRNQATLGGNLAHADPNQDPPATLIALNASVRLRSAVGERDLAVEDLFVDYYESAIRPGEVLTEIRIPTPKPGTGTAFLKFLPRTSDDYATVAAAASLRLEDGRCRDVRIALGSAGPTPIRARAAEAALEGEAPSETAVRAAAAATRDEADPISDVRGSAGYKRAMAEVFVRRAIERALAHLRTTGAPQ